jgi:hypothetical protein
MPEPTFDDVMDWLAEREGKQVYVEVGYACGSERFTSGRVWL